MVRKAIRKTHRTPLSRRRTKDVRQFADAAMADVASIATSLSLLIETRNDIDLDAETQAQIQDGIRGKIATAVVALQAIDAELGGAG